MARTTRKKSRPQHVDYPADLWAQRRAEFGDRLRLMYRGMGMHAEELNGYTDTDRLAAREGLLAMIHCAYCLGAIDTWMRHLLQVMIESVRHTGSSAQDRLVEMLATLEHSRCCTVHQYVATHGVTADIVQTFSKDLVVAMLASPKP